MKVRLHPRAIALGLLVDFGGTLLAAVVLVALTGLLAGAVGAVRGVTPDLDRLPRSPWFVAQTIVVGTGFSLLGGYVAGRGSPGAERLNGAVFAALTVSLSLALPAGDPPLPPAWVDVLSVALCLAAACGGAELARRERRAGPREEAP